MTAFLEKVNAVKAAIRSRALAVGLISVVLVIASVWTAAWAARVSGQNSEGAIHTSMQSGLPAIPELLPASTTGGYIPMNVSPYTQLNTVYGLLTKVTVTVDGQSTAYQVKTGTTVEQLLDKKGIEIGEFDLVIPKPEARIHEREHITIFRVGYVDFTEDQTIEFETVYKPSPLLKEGETKLLQEGVDGSKTVSYVRRMVDGEEEELHTVGEVIHAEAVDEVILVGAQVAVSDLDFDVELDANGKPVNYTRVLTGQVSTGYSARPGALTASGRDAITGHVAVNPNEIPYGTKLYITSSDNSFVYGCAVAADTGTGLMADIVDIDLFYDTYLESALNGRKYLDVYVLE